MHVEFTPEDVMIGAKVEMVLRKLTTDRGLCNSAVVPITIVIAPAPKLASMELSISARKFSSLSLSTSSAHLRLVKSLITATRVLGSPWASLMTEQQN